MPRASSHLLVSPSFDLARRKSRRFADSRVYPGTCSYVVCSPGQPRRAPASPGLRMLSFIRVALGGRGRSKFAAAARPEEKGRGGERKGRRCLETRPGGFELVRSTTAPPPHPQTRAPRRPALISLHRERCLDFPRPRSLKYSPCPSPMAARSAGALER